MISRLLRGQRARIRWTGLLLLSVVCAPLTIFAATPTPPTNGPGYPGQQSFPGGVPGQQFPPGGQFPPNTGTNPQFSPTTGGALGMRMGPTNPQQPMTVTVSLKVQDQKALDTFLHDLYDPTSPNFKHYLTPAAFTQRFITTGRQQVVDFLKNAKLSVTDRGIGSLVTATGTVDQVQTAFKVSISDYQDAGGTITAAADTAPTLPTNISAYIQSVIGLDNAIQLKPHMVLATMPHDDPAPTSDTTPGAAPTPPPSAQGCDAALSVAAKFNAFTPNQLATAYNYTPFIQRDERGQGQIVGLIEVDDFRDANVAAYQNCFGTNVLVTRVPVDGGTHPGPFQPEVELDIDVFIGMLPKLQQLLVYESDYRITSIVDGLQSAANDNLASVLSISFGGCEQSRGFANFIMPENTIFQQMAAQGQSVFAASGDSGSRDCAVRRGQNGGGLAVDDPASQPYVTGVGGTKLTVDPATGAYVSETVWNGFSAGGGAGGGGLSSFWSQPDYANAPGVSNSYSNGKRQVPDVAASADPKAGYIIYTADPSCARAGTAGPACFMATGGTSVAAPIWAAAAIMTNQHLLQAGYPRLGFANPIIYQLANSHASVFHDITTGHNCFDASCDTGDVHYPATAGYDLATGIGTFDAGAFADAVLASLPHINKTDPTTGSAAGGDTVTFTGANFKPGATVSFGGTPATNVRVVDDKTITAVTPAHATGTADIEVVTAGIRFSFPGAYTYSAASSQQPAASTTTAPSSTAATPPSSTPTSTATGTATKSPPAAQRFKVANTDGDPVNLRDKPDNRTGKVIATVPEGTEVQGNGGSVQGEGGTWYPVKVGTQSGFISADYLVPIS